MKKNVLILILGDIRFGCPQSNNIKLSAEYRVQNHCSLKY